MTDQQLTFRASMQSQAVQRYLLTRYRTRRDRRSYRRWERSHDKARS